MGLIGWIILGGIAGWIAKSVTGVGERRGCIFNIVIGVIGSVVGGMLFNALGGEGITGFNLWSLLVAAAGATVFLGAASLLSGR